MNRHEQSRKRKANHRIKQHRKAKRRQLAQQRAEAAAFEAERGFRALDGHTYSSRFTPAAAHSGIADEARRQVSAEEWKALPPSSQAAVRIIDEAGPYPDTLAGDTARGLASGRR